MKSSSWGRVKGGLACTDMHDKLRVSLIPKLWYAFSP